MRALKVKVLISLILLLYLARIAEAAEGNRKSGTLGLGVVLGDPTGISGKVWVGGNRAVDGLIAWSLRDFLFIQSHYLFHFRGAVENEEFVFYAGPGGFVRAGQGRDRMGVSGNFGIAYTVRQFEIFLELAPKVSIIPDTDGDLTGGLGFHYFF